MNKMKIGNSPVFRRFWYVAMPAAKLNEGPQPFSLFGEEMVIWQTADGTVSALGDHCCHRSARLSLGEAKADCIACPYHGWEFNIEGRCTLIPQRPDVPPPASAKVRAYRTAVRYGFVWVAVDDPLQPVPDLPEAEAEGFRLIPCFHETWDMSLFRLVDNWFDISHIAFVHRDTQGDISRPVPVKEDVEEFEFGLVAHAVMPVANREVGKGYTGINEETTTRNRTITWWAPNCRKLHINFPNGLQHIIFTTATPLADRKILFTQFCIRNDTEADVTAAAAIAHDRKVTNEDRVILESTLTDVPILMHEEPEVGMLADRTNNLARKKLRSIVQSRSVSVPALEPT
jgi:phenylpropionate dioxygenase-like ring-hydroxylating dioxygenase large terminal subunit